MSAQDFVVGDPIDSQVARKIQSLQRVFGDTSDGDTRRNYIELQSAIPWIRMQSGVSLSESLAKSYGAGPGYDLAKKYVLFGLNTRITETQQVGGESREILKGYSPNQGDPIGYDYDSTYGFGHRPKPGILDMSIHSHNRFGSLRTAVVKFQCWTRDQIDALEILYMRPGYSVLLEWGHSKILTTDGSRVIDMNLGVDLYEDGLDTAVEIRNRIVANKSTLHYGYDAILGVIKNFSWQIRPDGGYDCTTHLVTSGEMIESYKANFYLKQSVIIDDLQQNYKETIQDSPIGEIIWPALHKDAKAEFPDLGDLEAKIDQWVSQAEAAVSQAADAIDTFAGTASGEVLRDKLKSTLGTSIRDKITANNAKDVIDKFTVILKLLKVVRREQTLYQQEKEIVYYGGETGVGGLIHRETDRYPITVQNKWKWLVDFNETGNNFGAGQTPNFTFPGGARAAWMFYDPSSQESGIVNGAKLCDELLTALEINHTQENGNNINPVFTVLAEAFNLLKAVKLKNKEYVFDNSGQGSQVFFFNGANEGDVKDTGIYMDTNEKQAIFLDALKSKGAPTSYSFDGYAKALTPNFAYSIIGKDNVNSTIDDLYGNADRKGRLPNAKVEDDWLSVAPEDAKYPVVKGKKIEAIEASYIIPPGVARFPVMKWTGFDAEKAAAGTIVEGQDEETGETFKYYDPNDDYTSKLHYYLRTKLETPYAKAYLATDFGGRDFLDVFQYRQAPDGVVDELFDVSKAPSKNNTVPADVKSGLGTILGGRFFSDQDLEIRNHVYIKLGTLLELINRHTLRSDKEYFFTFQTSYGSTKYPRYFTFDDHISVDPRICILPHTTAQLGIIGAGDGLPKILNIELSINFILDTLNRYINADGKVAIYDYIQELLDGVVKATGGVNDYQLQYMEDDAVYHIVDRRVIAPNKSGDFGESRINVYGLNSVIKDINLVSKLTPKISSMIAISAQDSPYTSMDEATGFNAINRGMTDRVYTERYDVESKATRDAVLIGEIAAYSKFRDELKKDIIGIITNLGFYYSKTTVPRNSADTMYGTYENYCKFLLGGKVIFEEKGRATYNFVLPFELQFKMYGISGLKVMDAFLVDQTILPKTYGGDNDKPVGFLITGVEHTVNRNEWSSNIKSQIFNIGEDYQTNNTFTDLKTDLIEAVKDIVYNAGESGEGDKGTQVKSCAEITVVKTSGTNKVTSATSQKDAAKAVISYLEGGYFHPVHAFKDGKIKSDFEYYKNSGETLWGEDRVAGASESSNDPAFKKAGTAFWAEVDRLSGYGTYSAQNKTKRLKLWDIVKQPKLTEGWAWNYNPGTANATLLDNAVTMAEVQFTKFMTVNFGGHPLHDIILKDGRLMFMYYRARWNGPGWFRKFANNLKKVYDAGEKDVNKLICADLTFRYNAYKEESWKKGIGKIKDIIQL